MSAAANPRNKMLAAIHAAKRSKGLDDDTYRDLVERETGARSCAKLSPPQLIRVLDALNGRASNPRARDGGPMGGKIRALWASLWNLGLVNNNSDAALLAFVSRQTGREALRFLTAPQASKVIEALNAWAARPLADGGAGVNWSYHENPRVCVIDAQWKRLIDLGAFRTGIFAKLETWLRSNYGVAHQSFLSPPQADDCQRRLGRWIRKELSKGRQTT